MLTEIVFFGIDEMKQLPPCAGTVVVSILDQSEASQRPSLAGFRDVLAMQFEDTYEELKLAKPGDWPDEPSDAQHDRYRQGKGERVPALSDARRIVDFLKQHHDSREPLKLVVHCYGGISRSAAVASWAAVRFFVPLNTSRSTDRANSRLLRLMDKADNRR